MATLLSRIAASGYETIFRTLARRRPPKARPIGLTRASRVLCFTCGGIGDTLTDSVVFKALQETYPGIYLAGVVHRRRRQLLEHNPYVTRVFLFQKGPKAFWQLHDELRKEGPWDAILQLRGNDPEPRCLSYLLDPDVTVSVPDMTKMEGLCGHHVTQPDWEGSRAMSAPTPRSIIWSTRFIRKTPCCWGKSCDDGSSAPGPGSCCNLAAGGGPHGATGRSSGTRNCSG